MPSFSIRYSPESIDELQQAIGYLDTVAPGYGTKLLTAFEAEIIAISKRPYTRSVRYSDVRFAVIKRFHYSIHYTIKEESNTIIIQGFFSTWRDPANWKKRIG